MTLHSLLLPQYQWCQKEMKMVYALLTHTESVIGFHFRVQGQYLKQRVREL